jgi:hypothetical protein
MGLPRDAVDAMEWSGEVVLPGLLVVDIPKASGGTVTTVAGAGAGAGSAARDGCLLMVRVLEARRCFCARIDARSGFSTLA